MKKVILLIFIIVIVAVGWYLISPLWRNVELNDPSPLVVNDDFETMGEEIRKDFEEQTEAMKDAVTAMADTMPSGIAVIEAMGEFHPRAHEVEGGVVLIEGDGKKTLRFEDFKTINGPNLHIYLSSDLGDDDFIDLGKIKATQGNVNYEIDPSIDTNKYNKVLVWCVPFRVLFSYAELR